LLNIIKSEFNLKIDLQNILEMLKEKEQLNFEPMFIDGIFISTYKDKYDRRYVFKYEKTKYI